DPEQYCTGASTTCPAPTPASSTVVCRSAAGECDQAEMCPGVAGAGCPADAKHAASTACTDDGNPCTTDTCDGTSDACQHPAGNTGAECRPAMGPCDVAELCDGTSTACPEDAKQPAGTECRGAAGDCDVAATCDGSGDKCPANAFKPATTTCRRAVDECDAAENCTGTSATCPDDRLQPDGTACDDGGLCTQTDTCQSGACMGSDPVVCLPSDQCHDAGACDPATGACSDPAKDDGVSCNDANPCTQIDTCQSGTCIGSNLIVCTASDQCHDVGICNTSTGVCSNPRKADGTACNDGDACTQTDTCES